MALAFLAVIAVSVAATVYFTHRGSSDQAGSGGGSSASKDGIASAGDTGPVGIITEDPTCERWTAMEGGVTAQLGEWNKRDPSIPASAWTPEQKEMYAAAARVFQAEADRAVPLAKSTPHRVMRELYEQQIAYNRAYVKAIPEYAPADNKLVGVSNSVTLAINSICGAISNFSAPSRGATVPPAPAPTSIGPMGEPDGPKRFLTAPSSVCPAVQAHADINQGELEPWVKTESDASRRSTADKVLWDMAAKVLDGTADKWEKLGQSSGNPVLEDFLLLSSQYYRAFVAAMPTSTTADDLLYESARGAQLIVIGACDAVQG